MTADTLGTPRVITKPDGTVKSRHDYLPFGEEIPSSYGGRSAVPAYSVSDGVRQKFTSKERDNETGLDFFGARYYASYQGRFTSVDPREIGFESNRVRFLAYIGNPQNWNRYSYVLNNPLGLTDPDGREPNKAQAGTVQQIVAIIKQIERNNPNTSRMDILKKTDKHFRTQPDQAGNTRYVFTKESGWIDAKHFFAAANDSANSSLGEVGTNIKGLAVELIQDIEGDDSAFSYEDLGSNSAGADFGADSFDANGGPLSEQVSNYFDNTLQALYPSAAPNYNQLPSSPAGANGSRGSQTANSRTQSVQSTNQSANSGSESTKRTASDSGHSKGTRSCPGGVCKHRSSEQE
jgi:RHS repeat-associated protein